MRFRVLADDAVTAGATVDQPHRHGGDPGAHRELVGATGTVRDDLADELVPHDDVAVLVVDEHVTAATRDELRRVHVVHVRGADRGAERPQQQLAGTRHRIGRLPNLEPPASQHDSTHAPPQLPRHPEHPASHAAGHLSTPRAATRDAASDPRSGQW